MNLNEKKRQHYYRHNPDTLSSSELQRIFFGGGWVGRIHWTIPVHRQCYVKGGPFDFVPDSSCTTAQRFSIRNISNLCGGERPRYRNGNIWINKHMKKITLSVLSKCSQELPFFSNSWYVFCHLGRFLIGCIDFTNLIRTRRKVDYQLQMTKGS